MALGERSRQGFVCKAMPNKHQMIWWLGLEADFANANLFSVSCHTKKQLFLRIGLRPPLLIIIYHYNKRGAREEEASVVVLAYPSLSLFL